MVTIAINLALLVYVVALLLYAKKRGSDGRFCVATIHMGVAPPAVILSIVYGIKGEGLMVALMLLMASAAVSSSLQIKAENRNMESL